MITAEQIKKLRQETNISVMECKKALEEADGDEGSIKLTCSLITESLSDKKIEDIKRDEMITILISNTGEIGIHSTDFYDQYDSMWRDSNKIEV